MSIQSEYDKWSHGRTITGRLMQAIEELVQYQVDIIVNEENEWFNELLDKKLDERWSVEIPQKDKENQ